MPQDVPQLEPSQIDEIRNVLRRWGSAHPRRHDPLIRLADGSELTPAEISRAVRDPRSPIGALLLRVIAFGVVEDHVSAGRSVEDVLAAYRRDLDEWEGVLAG
jgi:hypothetical protein